MLGIDQLADGRQRVFGVDAVPFRDFRRGGRAGRCSFGARNRCRAKIGQRLEQFGCDLGRHERSDKRRLFKLVDGVFDRFDQPFNPRSAPKRAISLRASIAILSAFSSMRRARSASARRVKGAMGLPVGDETCDAGGDLARQAGLPDDDGQ